jgi:rhodanese-related sulfurtransferase
VRAIVVFMETTASMRRVRKLFAVLCVAVIAAACQRSPEPGAVAPGELAALVREGKAPVILDVRSPEEYAAGHIPGAINIPHTQLSARLAELPAAKSDEIVVHCQAGRRAADAEHILADAGYTGVRDLQGHMNAWSEAGLPVERSESR